MISFKTENDYPLAKRILIFGNSGSGKSWLGTQLSKSLDAPIIHFDKHFWEPGGFNKKRDKQIVFREIQDLSKKPKWIMEGVFGELAELALENASFVIFLDKTWEECRDALFSRGSESAKLLDPIQAEEKFKELLSWAENYWIRKDLRSQVGHQTLFDKARCKKVIIKSRQEMNKIISTLIQK